MNPNYQENLAFENKKAGITSTAVRKAVEAVSKVAKTLQVKVAGTTNSLNGGLYALNGTVRVKVKASYKGGEREITVPVHVRNGVVAEANAELISEKLNVVAKKELGSFTDVIKNIKYAGIQEIMDVEDDFYGKPEKMDTMEELEDGTAYNPNGWTGYKDDNDYVMIYKGKGGIEKGVGDVPFIAVDIEDGKEIGTANTVMQARKIIEEYIDSFYPEASKQAERKMFFVEAGKAVERKAYKELVASPLQFAVYIVADSEKESEKILDICKTEEAKAHGIEDVYGEKGTNIHLFIFSDSKESAEKTVKDFLIKNEIRLYASKIKIEQQKECDYLNNILVYASTSENAIKLASDFNDGKVEVEEVEFNGKKVAAVVEKQEKKAYKNIGKMNNLMIGIETVDTEEAEKILKIIKQELDSGAEISDKTVVFTMTDDDSYTEAIQYVEGILRDNGIELTASKIKALNKQAKEVTVNNGGSNANLPNAVESEIISYSKVHLTDDLEAGDEVNISGKKYKVEAKIVNGQESATEWNLRVIKE